MRKIIKYALGSVGLFFFMGPVFAQENDFTQYYLNLPAINPAFTGLDDFVDVKLGAREGWNSFGIINNNLYISAFGTLPNATRANRRNNSLRISNPEKLEEIQSDKKFRRRHGLGGMVTSRTVGPYRSTGARLNYAYHVPLSPKLNISLGTQAGYTNQRLDFSGLIVRDDVNDQFYQRLLQSGEGAQNILSLDFGMVVYSDKFFIGLSSAQLISERVNGDQFFNMDQNARYRLQSGTVISLNSEWELFPAVTMIQTEGYDFLWSANMRVRYKKLLYVGSAYEVDSKTSLLFGLTASNLMVHYSYDIYTSGLNNFNVNTHEVVLGIMMFNRYKLKAKFW